MTVSTESDAPAAAPTAPATRNRYGLGWLAATLVFGLLVGLAIGLLGPRLTTPGDDSVEALSAGRVTGPRKIVQAAKAP
jgi:hypothetical protein